MYKVLIVLLLSLPFINGALAQENLREALRGQTFGAAQEALTSANKVFASVLAPES